MFWEHFSPSNLLNIDKDNHNNNRRLWSCWARAFIEFTSIPAQFRPDDFAVLPLPLSTPTLSAPSKAHHQHQQESSTDSKTLGGSAGSGSSYILCRTGGHISDLLNPIKLKKQFQKISKLMKEESDPSPNNPTETTGKDTTSKDTKDSKGNGNSLNKINDPDDPLAIRPEPSTVSAVEHEAKTPCKSEGSESEEERRKTKRREKRQELLGRIKRSMRAIQTDYKDYKTKAASQYDKGVCGLDICTHMTHITCRASVACHLVLYYVS